MFSPLALWCRDLFKLVLVDRHFSQTDDAAVHGQLIRTGVVGRVHRRLHSSCGVKARSAHLLSDGLCLLSGSLLLEELNGGAGLHWNLELVGLGDGDSWDLHGVHDVGGDGLFDLGIHHLLILFEGRGGLLLAVTFFKENYTCNSGSNQEDSQNNADSDSCIHTG